MIAHIVLFRPKPDLSDADRASLASAFERALHDIPSIRRATIGRRLRHGAAYEQLSREDYPYVAIIEFDDAAALEVYLRHPAHTEPAQRFYAGMDAAVVFDYETIAGRGAELSLADWLGTTAR